MSRATKVKHVHKEVLEDFFLPEGSQEIVKTLASRGNNLHEVTNDSGEKFLASMPTKFRKNVWVKRGDFVVVEPIEEGDKVKAEIVQILYKEQIKYIKEEGKWPKGFELPKEITPIQSNSEEDDDDADLFVNSNRAKVVYDEDSSSEDEGSESEEE